MGLTAFFLLATTIITLHHEMWRDEMQAWLLARDSRSLIDLFHQLKYEGHPGLWHVWLLLLSRISRSPLIMQGFHLLIAGTTVYLFARYSPFPRFLKFLYAFGYFSLYEYTILCRNYALGVFLICLFCILMRRHYTRFLWVSFVLFLLGHTSVHALIVSIVTGFALSVDYCLNRKRALAKREINETKILLGFALIGCGVIAAVLQLNPPADSGIYVDWFLSYDAVHLKRIIQLITRAFFLMDENALHFMFKYPIVPKVNLILALALVLWCSLLLLRKPIVLLIYLLGTLGLLSFFYIKHYGGIRHHGFLFILFIMVLWIRQYFGDAKMSSRMNRFNDVLEKSLHPILTLILIVHLVGGVFTAYKDYRYVFSYGKQVAAFIREHDLQEMPMIGEADYAVSTVVGYLEKDHVYYMRGDRPGSFVIWDQSRTHEVLDNQIIEKAQELSTTYIENVLIILNRELRQDLTDHNSLIQLAKFTGSLIKDEEFYLYQWKRLAK